MCQLVTEVFALEFIMIWSVFNIKMIQSLMSLSFTYLTSTDLKIKTHLAGITDIEDVYEDNLSDDDIREKNGPKNG